MRTISGRNVNDLYAQGRSYIRECGEPQGSRAGAVVAAPHPVLSCYDKPLERVLFDQSRDANPFFHIAEGIWMLAGSADGTFLDQFIKGFSARYTEAHGGIHGAYGNRWRYHFDVDQLQVAIERLRRKPLDRRVVIGMWDTMYDLWDPRHAADDPNYAEPKDIPCNTHIYPRVRQESGVNVLDITVCCRSNDIIWGCYGANAVHFSMLQEYLAAGIGVEVGKMYQLSNNWHAYTDVLEKTEPTVMGYDYYGDISEGRTLTGVSNPVQPSPMVTNFSTFDQDVSIFMESPLEMSKLKLYNNRWFADTLYPMVRTMSLYRLNDRVGALECAASVQATDWRLAATQWLERRYIK